MATPFGIFNVDKPTGITSRDAVNRVERLFRDVKCGHAGTLDPLATGVLVVCVGQATRLIQYVQRLPKQYRAVFQFGRRSVTDDVEGDVELRRGRTGTDASRNRGGAAAISRRHPAASARPFGH